MNHLEKILTDTKQRADLIKVLNLAIHDFELNQCFWAYNNLSKLQKNLSPKVKKDFEDDFSGILIKLKWIALSRFNKNELLDLLEKNLVITKELFLDVFVLKEEIRSYLLGIISYEDRDQLKVNIRKSLLRNQEIIDTDSSIKTIGDWLRDITTKVGNGLADSLKVAEYYLNNKNFIVLKKENQKLLKQIIDLYRFCWLSSQTAEGLEESITIYVDGKYYTLDHGQIKEVKKFDSNTNAFIDSFINGGRLKLGQKKAIDNTSSLNKLQDYYHLTLKNLVTKDRFNALHKSSKSASIVLIELNSNLALKDTTAVLVNLESLVKSGSLNKILKDKVQSQTLLAYLKVRLNLANKELLKSLSPEVLSLFLQAVFVGKLSLKLEEAAVLSLYLANQLAKQGQKEFLNMVYGDTKLGIFKWRNIKQENNKLLFE